MLGALRVACAHGYPDVRCPHRKLGSRLQCRLVHKNVWEDYVHNTFAANNYLANFASGGQLKNIDETKTF